MLITSGVVNQMGMTVLINIHIKTIDYIWISILPIQTILNPFISTPKTTATRITFAVLFIETFICQCDLNPDDNNDRTIIQTCMGRIH